ncbi:hypothetical protein MTR67_038918, partial [Solanum verrucosum]
QGFFTLIIQVTAALDCKLYWCPLKMGISDTVRSLFPCIKSHSTSDGDDSTHNVEFAGGNVSLITTKESWDQKLAEAKKEGKITLIGKMCFCIGDRLEHLVLD